MSTKQYFTNINSNEYYILTNDNSDSTIYYIDDAGNFYVDLNGNYYIAGEAISGSEQLIYRSYKTYLYQNNTYKKYSAYIKNTDGSFTKVNPRIAVMIPLAIAGVGMVGQSYVGSSNI